MAVYELGEFSNLLADAQTPLNLWQLLLPPPDVRVRSHPLPFGR